MRVLIACEFSGLVRDAFKERGHDAWSCDLEPTERPGQHLQKDVIHVMNVLQWDLMVAFPPCTHLCVSGALHFHYKPIRQKQAIEFFMAFVNAPINKICIENPISIMSTKYRKPDQIIQPWQFGHGETKATCLWLKNLPKLTPLHVVEGRFPRVHYEAKSDERSKNRSRTYPNIAKAMAHQWSHESNSENPFSRFVALT